MEMFIDNDDGTVTDTRTGLIWMRCALGQLWDGSTCTGSAHTFTWNKAMTLQHSFAGYDDWHMPDFDELKSTAGQFLGKEGIDKATVVFPNSPIFDFWSASTCVGSSSYAWHLGFGIGGRRSLKSLSYKVRLVRNRQTEGTIKDNMVSMATKSTPDEAAIEIDAETHNCVDSRTCVTQILKRLDHLEIRLEASIKRVETVVGLFSTGQSETRDAIKLLLHRSATGTIQFATELAELRQMLASALRSANIHSPAAPQHTACLQAEASVMDNMTVFYAWLKDQETFSLSELRIRLLPLDLLPGAVINDINESALDLTGEPALLEDGDNVIVQRDVLLQIIAG